MSKQLEKLKSSRHYGTFLLVAMVLFFYGVFKILTPDNFGSPANLYSYLQSSIIYSVGGCGLYFIVVMGLFDFAVGANIVLSSIVGVILSKQFGYIGFILGCLGCGTLLGFLLAETTNTINTENFTEFTTALPTRLLDINGELITQFASDENREIISLVQLPQHMLDALITREDRVFYEHNGFRLKAILRAVVGVVTGKSLGGGSTLTQQIAGTLYCDRTEKSLTRKLKELWWAIQMERRWSKDEILELYLNKIYFGGGTYGVNAASKYYFGHDATQITPAEAAILVVQLSNPAYYNPFDYPNRAMARQQNVLEEMVNAGYLTPEEATQSYDDFWVNFDYTRINSPANPN